jgi:hypothetical protein
MLERRTVRGLGSRIFEISDTAPDENQGGQVKSASRICRESSKVHRSNKAHHNQIYSSKHIKTQLTRAGSARVNTT